MHFTGQLFYEGVNLGSVNTQNALDLPAMTTQVQTVRYDADLSLVPSAINVIRNGFFSNSVEITGSIKTNLFSIPVPRQRVRIF